MTDAVTVWAGAIATILTAAGGFIAGHRQSRASAVKVLRESRAVDDAARSAANESMAAVAREMAETSAGFIRHAHDDAALIQSELAESRRAYAELHRGIAGAIQACEMSLAETRRRVADLTTEMRALRHELESLPRRE